MNHHLHHVHLFASDLDKSIAFYRDFFEGEVVLDMVLAGARNVFMKVGNGRIHFYDQPPRFSGRASIHHFGIQTDDIEGVVEKMGRRGVVFKKGITDAGFWKYIMVPAPDDILIELFEVDKNNIPAAFQSYFERVKTK
ncbi:MAG: VOC family protein [Deltaproteobacteria bacterium]|nr:VOC family protein [Deltaproteobacteria bacterium]